VTGIGGNPPPFQSLGRCFVTLSLVQQDAEVVLRVGVAGGGGCAPPVLCGLRVAVLIQENTEVQLTAKMPGSSSGAPPVLRLGGVAAFIEQCTEVVCGLDVA
jgi:hypothetical protein